MGLFRSFVSPGKGRKFVQDKPKFVARILAIVLGAVTLFCSCSSVPLFIGFAEVKTIVERIGKWITLGVGLGALFHGYFPKEWASFYKN